MIEDTEFPNNTSSSKGPGERLRLMREAKSISLDEMAKQLRFTPQRLNQIEQDEYAAMGSSTFARGYLRSYARALDLAETEVEEVLRSFDSRNLASSIRKNTPVLINERMVQASSHASRRFGGWVAILLLLGIVGFWWHSHQKTTATDPNATPAASASTAPAAAPQQAAVDPNAQGTSNAVLQPLPIQTVTTDAPATTDNTTAAPKPDNTAAAANADSASDKPVAATADNSSADSTNSDTPKHKKHHKKVVIPADNGDAAPPSDNVDNSY